MKMWSGMASGRLQLFTFNLAIISFLDGAPSPSCRGDKEGPSPLPTNAQGLCQLFLTVTKDICANCGMTDVCFSVVLKATLMARQGSY